MSHGGCWIVDVYSFSKRLITAFLLKGQAWIWTSGTHQRIRQEKKNFCPPRTYSLFMCETLLSVKSKDTFNGQISVPSLCMVTDNAIFISQMFVAFKQCFLTFSVPKAPFKLRNTAIPYTLTSICLSVSALCSCLVKKRLSPWKSSVASVIWLIKTNEDIGLFQVVISIKNLSGGCWKAHLILTFF